MLVTVKNQTAIHNGVEYPAPGIGDGKWEVEFFWQYLSPDGWIACPGAYKSEEITSTRQIFVLTERRFKMSKNKKAKSDLSNHFYLKTKNGFVHVNMNPNADNETFDAIETMAELAYNMKALKGEKA